MQVKHPIIYYDDSSTIHGDDKPTHITWATPHDLLIGLFENGGYLKKCGFICQ